MIQPVKTWIVLLVKGSKLKIIVWEYVLKKKASKSHAALATVKYLKYASVELK
jgi:hypothetical protein